MTDPFGNPIAPANEPAPDPAPDPAQASWAPDPAITVPRGASGPRGGFWIRLVAALIDWGMLLVVLVILALVPHLRPFGGPIDLLIAGAYFVALDGGARGQTLGKRVMGIRVVGFDTGGRIGYGRAFVRWLMSIFSFWLFCLGYLWMLWDPERQCWHDKAANDVVVPVSAYPVD